MNKGDFAIASMIAITIGCFILGTMFGWEIGIALYLILWGMKNPV